MRILVVEDEKMKRVTLADDLATQGYEVVTAADGTEALEQMEPGRFDVVVTDLKMPKMDGIELLKRIKQGVQADVEVIMMTAYGSIKVAVEAVKLGAFDFITKPFRNEDIFPLLARIERDTPPAQPESRPSRKRAVPQVDQCIIGESAEIVRVRQMVEICVRSDANVLLCGETGCGKDLVASVIHRNSHRNGFPFIKVGCTLFPSQLIESELYGHEKGSFTGADQSRRGRFDLAEQGTLYLDDVDDIPLQHQSKLLRAIEEKMFERVGGTATINADVRIIASTKQNLLEKIGRGTFRQDLYYRLDVLRINLPPLRERLEDLSLLADHLLKRIAKGREYHFDPEGVAVLQGHDWPGNVRELYNTLERAFLISPQHSISADLLTDEVASPPSNPPLPTNGFQAAMNSAERQLLEDALQASGGNKTAAANALGMRPSTFRDKLTKHELG